MNIVGNFLTDMVLHVGAYNEGGTIERKREKKFLSYAEKTRFTYDRITIVFEKLASEYHHMGDREDVNAKLEDLDN